jgi:cytochrome c553
MKPLHAPANRYTSKLILGLIVVALVACKTQKATTTSTASVPLNPTYLTDVKPIVDASCGNKCHSASKTAGGIDLSNYEGVKKASLNNHLLQAIKHESGAKAMPRFAGKLNDVSIATIEKWINNDFAQ